MDTDSLLKQLEQWNEESEFSRAIQAIETVPEGERTYALTLWLGRLYSNLAVLGDKDRRQASGLEPDQALIRKSLAILETIRREGENDATWNSRMALALEMAEGGIPLALPYARRWMELEPEEQYAAELVKGFESYLLHMEKGKKKY